MTEQTDNLAKCSASSLAPDKLTKWQNVRHHHSVTAELTEWQNCSPRSNSQNEKTTAAQYRGTAEFAKCENCSRSVFGLIPRTFGQNGRLSAEQPRTNCQNGKVFATQPCGAANAQNEQTQPPRTNAQNEQAFGQMAKMAKRPPCANGQNGQTHVANGQNGQTQPISIGVLQIDRMAKCSHSVLGRCKCAKCANATTPDKFSF